MNSGICTLVATANTSRACLTGSAYVVTALSIDACGTSNTVSINVGTCAVVRIGNTGHRCKFVSKVMSVCYLTLIAAGAFALDHTSSAHVGTSLGTLGSFAAFLATNVIMSTVIVSDGYFVPNVTLLAVRILGSALFAYLYNLAIISGKNASFFVKLCSAGVAVGILIKTGIVMIALSVGKPCFGICVVIVGIGELTAALYAVSAVGAVDNSTLFSYANSLIILRLAIKALAIVIDLSIFVFCTHPYV